MTSVYPTSVAAANDCIGVNNTEGSSAVSIFVSMLPSMASFPVGHFMTSSASGVKEVLSGITSGMMPACWMAIVTAPRGSRSGIVCMDGSWRRALVVESQFRLSHTQGLFHDDTRGDALRSKFPI